MEGRPLREYEEQVDDEIRLDLHYAARLARYQATIRTHPGITAEMTVAAGDGLMLALAR